MKFKITRENLQMGIAAVMGSVATRTTLPILSNVLIEANADGFVRLSATDLDVSTSVTAPAEVDAEGALTIPAKKPQELVRELAEHPVRMNTKGDRLEITCGRASFKLNGMPRDEFPTFPAVDFGRSWKIQGKVLHELIKQTSFAVSTEESRPILNGVLWQLGDDAMRMVATNGHRLARMNVTVEGPASRQADVVIPPKALAQVARLFSQDDEIEVAHSDNYMGFQNGGARVFTRLIEGPYPNYEQVIPKDNDKLAKIDRRVLVSSLRRMGVIASDQTHRTRLSFMGNNVLHLAVETPDLGEANEDIEIDYTGDQVDIGFDASYLLEILTHISGDEVDFAFKAPERAATIVPSASGTNVPDYLCLLMPLRLLD